MEFLIWPLMWPSLAFFNFLEIYIFDALRNPVHGGGISQFFVRWIHYSDFRESTRQKKGSQAPINKILCILILKALLAPSEFMGKTFQAAQLTHERFLTIDHSCKIFF